MARQVTKFQLDVLRMVAQLEPIAERERVAREEGRISFERELDDFWISSKMDVYLFRIDSALDALTELGLVTSQRGRTSSYRYATTEDGRRMIAYHDSVAWYQQWRQGAAEKESA